MEAIPDPIPVAEPYFDLGPCHFPITTTSPAAQEWFDRGLALCYSFNHEEAVRCFYQCLAHDLECPMAYWGIAYSLGANYNKTWELFEPGEVDCVLPKIKAALDRINELEVKGDKLETALIGSLRARMPDDLERRDYEQWNRAYIAAMREVYKTFPDNLDVTALYAEAMMVLTPWKLWDVHTGLPAPGSLAVEIETVLETAMKRFPSQADRHPGILHFYIHLTEMSSSPEKALPAANALQDLLPDAGHIQHMPSHIYFLAGDYQRAIRSNQLAVQADEKYVNLRGPGGFYLVYRMHSMEFIVYSAMFAGQYQVAMRYVEMIERNLPLGVDLGTSAGYFIEATYAIRVQVYVRFGRWDEIKALPLPSDPSVYPITTAFTHWGKAIAHSATRDVPAAEASQKLYLDAFQKVPATALMFPNTARDVLSVGTAFLQGELEYRKGNYDTAFSSLEESIRLYDNLVYTEPWSWLTPVRHAYAALKLEQGCVSEALSVYYADLGFNDTLARAHQHPGNIWALRGAYECLLKLGKEREGEARIVWALLRTAMAMADVEVEVSCFCRIGERGDEGEDLVRQGESIGRVEDGVGKEKTGCCA
jgi:tetratricopeptide (TPR) repeat protein